jgi:uncharacterized membrane protein
MRKNLSSHYTILILIIILGVILRFSYLDFKPWGIDEVITSIFSLGLTYEIIPQNSPISLTELTQLFILKPHQSCDIIAQNLIKQSTHPPLFFCSLHYWLNLINDLPLSLLTKVRSLPALFGILAIPLIYLLNRVAFSKKAGLMGALIMAISPFHLYLSQEARHYTLPIAIIIISLTLFIKIYQNIQKGKNNLFLWIIWSLINSLSLYIHYFSAIALMAEYLTLFVILAQSKFKQLYIALGSCVLSGILFFPWISIVLSHAKNDKTSWLSAPEGLSPLFQSLIAWILMIIALPVEEQSLIIQIIMGCLTFILTGIFLFYLIPKFKKLRQNYPATFPLILFIGFVLLEFIFIVYFLGKDITIAPRYHFIYYPAICAIIGASLAMENKRHNNITYLPKFYNFKNFIKQNYPLISIITISLISCYFVLINLALNKPYRAQFVTDTFNQSPDNLTMVMGYHNFTEMALGISYGLTLEKMRKSPEKTYLVLFNNSEGYHKIWAEISELSPSEDQLWIIAPGILDQDFPAIIHRQQKRQCDRQEKQFYRIGFPFQGYICSK